MTKNSKEKLFIKISVILLVSILILGAIYIVISQQQTDKKSNFTMIYKDISPKEAFDLLNQSINNTEFNLIVKYYN